MRSDKSYEKSAYGKLDDNYQSIVVAPNIKNVMLVTYVISIREIYPNIREIVPLCIFCNLVPSLQCNLRVFSSRRLIELFQLSM